MRRGTVIPGLLVLALGMLLVRLRRARAAGRAPTPVAGPVPAASLPAVPEVADRGPHFLSIPWQLVAPPDDGTELEIGFARSEHEALDRVDVQETPTQVFVTVIVRWRPHVGGPFAAETQETATVVLGRPLGDRELVHGATDVDDAGGRPLYP